MSRRLPTLETRRLIIRELALDDFAAINRVLNEAAGSDTSIHDRRRWLQWTVLGYEMLAKLEQPHFGERAVVLKENGELVGAVGIVPYLDTFNRVAALKRALGDAATAEFGLYWAIAPAHQRRGIATEAARALVQYLFAQEKLGRIITTTGYDNLASQGVMRKLGMTIECLEEPQPPDQFVVGVLQNDLVGGEGPARTVPAAHRPA